MVMNKSMFKNVLIVLLLTITIYSVFQYISGLKENYDLLIALNQVKERASMLEQEKQNLLLDLEKAQELKEKISQDNATLKDYLKASKDRLSKIFADYAQVQKRAEDLNAQFSLLKAEHKALTEDKEKLTRENEILKAKISSAKELKLAMRELRKQVQKVHKEIKQSIDADSSLEGNQGYIIKDGKSTFLNKVKIEVIPVEEEK